MKRISVLGALLFSLHAAPSIAQGFGFPGPPGPTPVPTPFYITFAAQPGSCSNPLVSIYEAFEELSGNLTVPTGCSAAGTTWSASGSPTYRVTGAPIGLSYAIQVNNPAGGPATDYFTESSTSAGDVNGQSFVVDFWFRRKTTANTTPVILSKNFDGTGTSPDGSWEVYLANGLGRPTFEVDQYYGAGNTLLTSCSARDSVHVANDTMWHQLHAVWSAGSQVCSVALDGNAPTTGTPSGHSSTITSLTNTNHLIYGTTDSKDFWADVAVADLQIAVGTSSGSVIYTNPEYLNLSVLGTVSTGSLSATGSIKPTSAAAGASTLTNFLSQQYTISFGAFTAGVDQAQAETFSGVLFGDTCSVGTNKDLSACVGNAWVAVTSASNIKIIVSPLNATTTCTPTAATVFTVNCTRH